MQTHDSYLSGEKIAEGEAAAADFEGADVREAILAALERRGAARGLRARVRAEVFAALNEQQASTPALSSQPRPDLSGDMHLCIELLRDFMSRSKLDATMSVLEEETGLRDLARGGVPAPMDRRVLAREVGLSTIGSDDEIPLLLLLLQGSRSAGSFGKQ